jgi:hypothetical protein
VPARAKKASSDGEASASDKLRALLTRAGVRAAVVSRLAGYPHASGLQKHLDSGKAHFQPQVVERLLPVLVGLGNPPIKESEVLALQYPINSPQASRVTTDVDLRKTEPVQSDDGPLGPLPVWASAEGGGPEGAMSVDNRPIDWVRRHPEVRSVADAFAVYLLGDSMRPRYEQGDRLTINPQKPIKPGDDALLIRQDSDGQEYALVKRVLGWNGQVWRVRQYNPEKDFELQRKVWQRAWLVVR